MNNTHNRSDSASIQKGEGKWGVKPAKTFKNVDI